MTNFGTTFGQDYTFKITDVTKTVTSQYKVCFPNTVTSASDFTVDVSGTTTVHHRPVGIIQSCPDANSDVATVRMTGISRAVCSDSVEAFEWVTTDSTGTIRDVVHGTELTITTAAIVKTAILGLSLETGETEQTILIDLRPHLATYNVS